MIRVGVVGRIASGDEQGRYVLIKELPDVPPSYLILTAADSDFQTAGGDSWVEDEASLQQFFDEARWVVAWRQEGEEKQS
ncbi:hypothetical protein ACFY1P_32425 [Streptomyces sp. NPDC001407]|uniref:hypothetical protein n=1 Tax=Streptomyces sp. NPDC001407 TaxID=3364573 RepID=UPI003695EEF7